MKIAILVYEFPPIRYAGTGVANYYIARDMAKRGHEIHIITPLYKGLPKESEEDRLYIHRVKFIGKPLLATISYLIEICRVIKRYNPDFIQVQGFQLALHALLIKKIFKKPYIIWGRGIDVYEPAWFYKPFYRLSMKNADALIAQTSDMKREIQKFCNRYVYVIPNGIDLSRFSGLSRRENRSKLKIRQGDKVILFVGRLHKVKGVKYLIQAIDLIRHLEPNARLMLIGDGKERHDLEQLSSDLNLRESVVFTGKVPHEKIRGYMAAGDIFVLPSLSEGFPNVILEAMAVGLPLVATNVGGLSEIVHSGKNGFLVEPRSPTELAEKMMLLLKNDELRKEISRYNREKVKEYTWDTVNDQLEMVYQDHFIPHLHKQR